MSPQLPVGQAGALLPGQAQPVFLKARLPTELLMALPGERLCRNH